MSAPDLIASGVDGFGPWVVPADRHAPKTFGHEGRTFRYSCGYGYKHRTRGPWWRFWRRWDVRWLDIYRPEEVVVFAGGPADGLLYETTAATPSVISPVPRQPARLVAAWGGEALAVEDVTFTRATYHRTRDTDAAGRTIFRHEDH